MNTSIRFIKSRHSLSKYAHPQAQLMHKLPINRPRGRYLYTLGLTNVSERIPQGEHSEIQTRGRDSKSKHKWNISRSCFFDRSVYEVSTFIALRNSLLCHESSLFSVGMVCQSWCMAYSTMCGKIPLYILSLNLVSISLWDQSLWSLLKLCLAVTSFGPMCDLSVPCSFTEMPRYSLEYTTLTLCMLGARGVK